MGLLLCKTVRRRRIYTFTADGGGIAILHWEEPVASAHVKCRRVDELPVLVAHCGLLINGSGEENTKALHISQIHIALSKG